MKKQIDRSIAAIETVSPELAEGRLAGIYSRIAPRGAPANIYRAHSLHPEALEAHADLYRAVMFARSPLSRAQRELVATLVSRANDCHY